MKHYRLREPGSETESQVWLLFELKVDLQDVRSGYRQSDWGLYLAAPWLDDHDLEWTQDMVRRFDPQDLEETDPRQQFPWPDVADQKMISYMVRYYRPRAWRNAALGLFSHPRETREEFLARCRDALREARERELRRLREVFNHRFVEMEHRFAQSIERQQFDEQWKGRRLTEVQELFNRVGEDLSRRFLDLSRPIESLTPVAGTAGIDPENLQKLDDLRRELVDKYNLVLRDSELRASEIEPYEVPLSYPQIEIVSRSVLWG